VAGRVHLDRAAARRERLTADALEGEALSMIGDVHGLELVEAALASAELFGSPALIAEMARALARTAGRVGGERAALAQARAEATLSGTVSGQ
jgi:hypothetical protein